MHSNALHSNARRRKRPARTPSGAHCGGEEVIVLDGSDGDEDDRKPPAKLAGPSGGGPVMISLLDAENSPRLRKRKRGGRLSSSTACKPSEATDLFDSQETDPGHVLKMQRRREKKKRALSKAEEADRLLALKLQEQEDRASKRANSRKEKRLMQKSNEGRAVLAVQEIIALVKRVKDQYVSTSNLRKFEVDSVTIDDMVFFATNMLDLQEEFVRNNVSGFIDIGFHYTGKENLANIRNHGLMTKAEREKGSVQVASKGAVFGDGIYTANGAVNFSNYGNLGIVVGRLQGNAVRAMRSFAEHQRNGNRAAADANTMIGDKMIFVHSSGALADGWPCKDDHHEIVLRSSRQCLPMIRFDQGLIHTNEGKVLVEYIKKELEQIMNRLFNRNLRPNAVTDAQLLNPANRGGLSGAAAIGLRRAVPMPPMPMPPSAPAHPAHPAQFFINGAPGAGMSNFVSNMMTSAGMPLPSFGAGPLVAAPGFAPPPAIASANPPAVTFASGRQYVPGQTMPPPLVAGAPAVPTTVTYASRRRHRPGPSSAQTLTYTAPATLNGGVPANAYKKVPRSHNMNDDCVICMDPLRKGRCVALRKCGHSCIARSFLSSSKCPVCRVTVGEPQGKSPSGTMTVSIVPTKCAGCSANDTIMITYSIRPGVQMPYHDNPGRRQPGKSAAAYLPNCREGNDVLRRLKYAFLRGLTFTVGTSMTTGARDQCTWASVHHKTAQQGGARAHGYPDPQYLANANGELDALGVPKASDLDDRGNEKLSL
ncbi:hypothetical protein THAOC_21237 [Thalassiosira oceanica]|uniref:RING-type E3 ubiquitin transferase n=1 Tax=Thalassiosira oceanica TaxID=159749 RepID=K0S1H8_THAOC|nr:hypothetical protein THAOC_21237 [Thalassiosira oceanica]|eukprot:EJK58624.1 hypothetical protein THAOC_21237 [Thalassiosira oceanica]